MIYLRNILKRFCDKKSNIEKELFISKDTNKPAHVFINKENIKNKLITKTDNKPPTNNEYFDKKYFKERGNYFNFNNHLLDDIY